MKGQQFIVFMVGGTPSLDILGTAVIQAIKKKHKNRDIVVVSNNPEIWLHNPNVYRVYKTGITPYFHDDYLEGKDTLLFAQNPQNTDDFLNNRGNIIEIWCKLCDVPCSGEKPELFFTQRELEVTQKILHSEKPIFLFQYKNIIEDDWSKDIPFRVISEVVIEAINKGYQPIQLKNNNQELIHGALAFYPDIRTSICALKFAEKRLFIDSYLQHASFALDLSSVVIFITGDPEVLGHNINTNIKIEPNTDFEMIFKNHTTLFPQTLRNVDTTILFNVKDILNKLNL